MPASPPPVPRLAVLIDAENTNPAHVPALLARVQSLGRPALRWAYGDWTTTQLTPWKKHLLTLGIRPRQQFRAVKGKNSSDAALIVDAMDLLHGGRVDGFCIVSSDSDYAVLAARIREAGLPVYGFGERWTLEAFVAACDEFVFLGEAEVSVVEGSP
jgi:hypothetical protein